MANKWREFEKLVSRIEGLLAQKGAIVKSPDRIKDKVKGQKREVDASIRIQVGSVNILITVECRDRVSVPDDTWIEQLATKKQKSELLIQLPFHQVVLPYLRLKAQNYMELNYELFKILRTKIFLLG